MRSSRDVRIEDKDKNDSMRDQEKRVWEDNVRHDRMMATRINAVITSTLQHLHQPGKQQLRIELSAELLRHEVQVPWRQHHQP